MEVSKHVKIYVKLFGDNLQAIANPESKVIMEKYMRNIQEYRGVKIPGIKTVYRDVWRELKKAETPVSKEVAHELIRSKYGEDKYGAMLIFEGLKKDIVLDDINRITKLFEDGTLAGWANTDAACTRIFKHWCVGNPDRVNHITSWKNSKNIWLQRASCVSFVVLAKHGDKDPNYEGFLDKLIETCGVTIKNPERFVQLGTGWLLREIGVADKKRLHKFIEENYKYFSREGLRYAIEKLPNSEQKRFLNMNLKKDLEEEEIETKVSKRVKKNGAKADEEKKMVVEDKPKNARTTRSSSRKIVVEKEEEEESNSSDQDEMMIEKKVTRKKVTNVKKPLKV